MSKKSFENRKKSKQKKPIDKTLQITLVVALINLVTATIEFINKLLK
ncbi:hypothetical protein [Anaerococcus tetradius]|nr:hypothetical protein [Anaerococcus tetradius]